MVAAYGHAEPYVSCLFDSQLRGFVRRQVPEPTVTVYKHGNWCFFENADIRFWIHIPVLITTGIAGQWLAAVAENAAQIRVHHQVPYDTGILGWYT